jgi:hypothetical protein
MRIAPHTDLHVIDCADYRSWALSNSERIALENALVYEEESLSAE